MKGQPLNACKAPFKKEERRAVVGKTKVTCPGKNLSWNWLESKEKDKIPGGPSIHHPLRPFRGQGPHLAKMWEPRGFYVVAAGFSSYDVDFRLPLVLALGSPNFPSSCEGKLDVVLESLQGQRDLI